MMVVEELNLHHIVPKSHSGPTFCDLCRIYIMKNSLVSVEYAHIKLNVLREPMFMSEGCVISTLLFCC